MFRLFISISVLSLSCAQSPPAFGPDSPSSSFPAGAPAGGPSGNNGGGSGYNWYPTDKGLATCPTGFQPKTSGGTTQTCSNGNAAACGNAVCYKGGINNYFCCELIPATVRSGPASSYGGNQLPPGSPGFYPQPNTNQNYQPAAPPVQSYNPAPPVQSYNPAPPVQSYNPAPPVQSYNPAPTVQSYNPAPQPQYQPAQPSYPAPPPSGYGNQGGYGSYSQAPSTRFSVIYPTLPPSTPPSAYGGNPTPTERPAQWFEPLPYANNPAPNPSPYKL